LIIGTRGSKLARWQAEFIKGRLEKISDISVRLKIIKTQGDKIQHLSFEKMEGKGFFTKEIENCLISGEIDLAVHSLKDLMTTMPPGLALSAVGFREDNREALLARKESSAPDRPLKVRENGIIGSSSLRRQCQIAALSPDLRLKDLRGNVPTRINKLREGQYDAIIIAYAGLKRLEISPDDLEMHILPREYFLPAPGQGILALQTREDDPETIEIVSRLNDYETARQAKLERGLLARFEGGCHLPLGAYSEIEGDEMILHALLGHRREGKWKGLNRVTMRGEKIEPLIENAYKKLKVPA